MSIEDVEQRLDEVRSSEKSHRLWSAATLGGAALDVALIAEGARHEPKLLFVVLAAFLISNSGYEGLGAYSDARTAATLEGELAHAELQQPPEDP